MVLSNLLMNQRESINHQLHSLITFTVWLKCLVKMFVKEAGVANLHLSNNYLVNCMLKVNSCSLKCEDKHVSF